jgi:hypothetical protein
MGELWLCMWKLLKGDTITYYVFEDVLIVMLKDLCKILYFLNAFHLEAG